MVEYNTYYKQLYNLIVVKIILEMKFYFSRTTVTVTFKRDGVSSYLYA